MSQERPRPSLSDALTNWRESSLPFFSRMGKTMRNNWTKLRTRQNCCGNYGEPGC